MDNNYNLYTDIEESILRNFSFLKSYGFADFKREQLAYETHFSTKNGHVHIDISFEAIASSPIWVQIGSYYIGYLEPENPVLEKCSAKKNELYDALFQTYLEENDQSYLEKIGQCYVKSGKDINEVYLKECSEIIQRHTEILRGDLAILAANTEQATKERNRQKLEKLKTDETYTLEYQAFAKGDILDAYEEFASLIDIIGYLNQNGHIEKYRILDCNGNEVEQL